MSLGLVCLMEVIAFSLLYRFTRWQGKQVAFLVILVTVGLYIPYGVLTWKSLDHFAIHFAFYVMIPYVLGIITTHWEVREEVEGPSRTKWFHWGPATMVFFFIGLAAVDSAIISFAENGMSSKLAGWLLPDTGNKTQVTSVFPGTVSHDFQEKEKQFNAYLQQRREQEARGWKIRKGWVGPAKAGEPALFRIAVEDKSGGAITGASVVGDFLRPADERYDQAVELAEVNPGMYEVELTLPVVGTWDTVLTITRGDDRHEVRASTRIAAASGQ